MTQVGNVAFDASGAWSFEVACHVRTTAVDTGMIDLSTLLSRWTGRAVYSGRALGSLLRLGCVGGCCILRLLLGRFRVVGAAISIVFRVDIRHFLTVFLCGEAAAATPGPILVLVPAPT
jgi:hypothetical protein